MINNDSIVTAYDEHLTLVEWLQKVEKALNESVLTNLGIAKLSDQDNIATYRVTATFADNTTIVSDTFTLPSTNIVTAFNNLTTLVNGFDTRITDNTNNIARALFTPSSAPSTRKVVTIDTNGAQDNVDGTELTTLMGNIVDSHGNKRFVEDNISLNNIRYQDECTGITKYNKYSLSGTHLMIVVAGEIERTGDSTADIYFALNLPEWIRNKISALTTYSGDTRELLTTATTTFVEVGTSQTTAVTSNVYSILPAKYLSVLTYVPNGATGTKYAFRTQIDLLIDSE